MNSPKIRPSPDDKARMLDTLREAIRIVESMPEDRSCTTCDWFNEGVCDKWGADVPVEHLATGCDEWVVAIKF